MKFVSVFAASLCSAGLAQAAAPAIAPTEQAPTCFRREYTPTHMRANPEQKLEAMYVKLSRHSHGPEGDQPAYRWNDGEVVGVSRGVYYGNTAGCEMEKDGSAHCQIECDGGAFYLRASQKFAGAVNFQVQRQYYFPLYKGVMTQPENPDAPKIDLSDDDAANRVYRLVPVNASICDEAISRVTAQGDGGC